jgi:hypothetical protein
MASKKVRARNQMGATPQKKTVVEGRVYNTPVEPNEPNNERRMAKKDAADMGVPFVLEQLGRKRIPVKKKP